MELKPYEALIPHVRRALEHNGGNRSSGQFQAFRTRSEHCRRVLRWCGRLAAREDVGDIDRRVLYLSAVFHDVGYNDMGRPHEELGAEIFRDFAREHGLDAGTAAQVERNILLHSDKSGIRDGNAPMERILLMEADLLDEEGAMGIAVDCLTLGASLDSGMDYAALLAHLRRHAGEILEKSPMATPYAARCWERKQKLVAEFLEAMAEDVFAGEE